MTEYPVSVSSHGRRRARPLATDPRAAETGLVTPSKDRKPGKFAAAGVRAPSAALSFGVGVALVVLIAWAALAGSESRSDVVETYRPVILRTPYSSAVGPGLAQLAHEQGADQPYLLPNPRLTPGAIRSTSSLEICVPGYPRAHRVWHDKAQTLAKYGMSESQAGEVEDDDLVPVCLGGDNADPRNHWGQPWAEAKVKDEIEAAACRKVCAVLSNAGPETADEMLGGLQEQFQTDWRALIH